LALPLTLTAAPASDLAALAAWVGASAPAQLMRGNAWLYPLVETVHILGFVLLVGAVAMFDLRLLGFGRQLPPRDLARHLLPWSAASLLLVVPSGLLLFASQPGEMLASRTFLLKMGLMAAAGLNALLFHRSPWWRASMAWLEADGRTRVHAGLSLLLWIGVIACGRLIAYI
jgi:hypothetical protein